MRSNPEKGISLITSFVLGFLLFQCTPTPISDKPNVLFIAIDDLKPTIGAYNDSIAITPHIDELAREGAVFLNNHCQQAVCAPARASLLTGLYPDQIQVWGFKRHIRNVDFDVLTLPQHFKNEGYRTYGISKIFDYRSVDYYKDSLSWSEPAFPLTEEEMTPHYAKGFGRLAGYFYRSELVHKINDSIIDAHPGIADSPEGKLHRVIKPATECLDLPDDAYKDGVFANVAIQKLMEFSTQDKPFFLAVGFERPHLPYVAPKKYWDLYNPDKLPLSPFQEQAKNDIEYAYTTSGSIKSYTDEEGNFIYRKLDKGVLLTSAEQRKLIHGYYASSSYIDAQIGKILSALDDLGLSENTIVVLWGDHGYHLYDHSIWGKSTNFEQGTRSPLVIKAPGITSMKTNVPTEFTDIFPTLCTLADIPLPEHLSGQSLEQLMQGNVGSVKGYAISQFNRDEKMGYAIRTERYRYVEWLSEGRHVNPEATLDNTIGEQLFDYAIDPLETKNLAHESNYAELKKELREKLHAFYSEQILAWEEPGWNSVKKQD